MTEAKLDDVGIWTEIKLKIIRDYSAAYSAILSKQSVIRHYAYIDGFAGPGTHISRTSGEEIEGSPAIALSVPFSHYHFIDMDGTRAARLRKIAGDRQNVSVYEGDCNTILINKVFPTCRYENYRRGLCLLDPYSLNPDWEIIQTAGQMRSIEIFHNFMLMDANMNVLWADPEKVPNAQIIRMNKKWGDDSWKKAAYRQTPGLFGKITEKEPNKAIILAYQKRLKEVAGFKYVPDPIPMRNNKGDIIYYLFFASHNKVGDKIARDIFKKYRNAGITHG